MKGFKRWNNQDSVIHCEEDKEMILRSQTQMAD
jgi:hypothetical protein